MNDSEVRWSPDFLPLLETFDSDLLENSTDTIYGIWADLRLAYFNPSWFRFAEENQGEPEISSSWRLGRSVMDCVPQMLRPFYELLYRAAFVGDRGGHHPVQHQYECSSPDLFRNHLMTLYPIGSEGMVVVNSALVQVSHASMGRKQQEAARSAYAGTDGYITMCANCRRTKNLKEPDRWDWVPEWVGAPPIRVTHGLCSLCVTFYYGKEYL